MRPRTCAALAPALLCAAALASRGVMAQSSSSASALSLSEAVQFALDHHPAVAGAAARAAAARAGREAAAAARLPSLDIEAQLLRATGNVIAGATFPMPNIPGLSGPVGTTSVGNDAWGATTGLVTAMPLTGFVRANRVAAARLAAEHAAQEGVDVTRLDVAFHAASAYLRVLGTAASLGAAEASVRRAQALLAATGALVTPAAPPGLRPCARPSRAGRCRARFGKCGARPGRGRGGARGRPWKRDTRHGPRVDCATE